MLYLRHCSCAHNHKNCDFKVVQFTSQITSTSNKAGGGGMEIRLLHVEYLTLKCPMQIPLLLVETVSKGNLHYTFQHGLSYKTRTASQGEILC